MMTQRSPVPRLRDYQGPAILSYGFRPFFLLGAVYAGLAILVWLPVFLGELTLWTAFVPRDWHVHEMLYGYLPAVITGFLFTAIPNWTGRLPIQGSPLLVLVIVWILGRIAVTCSAASGADRSIPPTIAPMLPVIRSTVRSWTFMPFSPAAPCVAGFNAWDRCPFLSIVEAPERLPQRLR